MTTVSILGTGRMGAAMARALAGPEIELRLYNRSLERARAVAGELGARAVASVAEAADADVCISMLADRDAVDAVWDGPDGLAACARTGAILVDASTVPPDTLQAYADRVRAARAGILDAPVSGSVGLAEAGQLTIMAGGEPGDFERARPVLDRLAKTVFHMGPLGSGHAMKLAVNAVIFALNNAVSEALVLAERAGISRELAYDVLATSAAGAPYIGYKRDAFLEPDATPVAFAIELAVKDLRLITELAARLGVTADQATVNQSILAAASAGVGPDRDFSAVAAHLRALTDNQDDKHREVSATTA